MRYLVLILIVLISCRNDIDNNSQNDNELFNDKNYAIEEDKLKLIKTNLTYFVLKLVLEDSLNGILKNDNYLLEVEDITMINLPIAFHGNNHIIDKTIRDSLFSIVYNVRTFSNSILLNSDFKIIPIENFNYRKLKKIRILYKKIEKKYVDIVLNVYIDQEWSSIEYLRIEYNNLFNFKIIAKQTVSIS